LQSNITIGLSSLFLKVFQERYLNKKLKIFNHIIMKNLLYIIAGLLVIIWGIIFFSFDASAFVHALLIIAGIIVLIRVLFDKKLSKN
jgi:hypothetical protein